jgi:hypothetical protein
MELASCDRNLPLLTTSYYFQKDTVPSVHHNLMTKKQRYKVHKIVVSVLFLKLIKLTKYIPNA